MYEVRYESSRIKRELSRLSEDLRRRILDDIQARLVRFSPWTRGVKRLSGNDQYRLRCGQYRVLFTVSGRVITVTAVRPRRDAYRR